MPPSDHVLPAVLLGGLALCWYAYREQRRRDSAAHHPPRVRARLEACVQPEQLRQAARVVIGSEPDLRQAAADGDVCAWLCATVSLLPDFNSFRLSDVDAAELRKTLLAVLSKVAQAAYSLRDVEQLGPVAELVARLLEDPSLTAPELEWLCCVAYPALMTTHSVAPLRRAILARVGRGATALPAELVGLLPMVFSSDADPAVMLHAWSHADQPAVIAALARAATSADTGARGEACKAIMNMSHCELHSFSLPAETIAQLAHLQTGWFASWKWGASALYNICDSRSQGARALAEAEVPQLVLNWVGAQFSSGSEQLVSFVRQKGLAALVCLASRGPLAVASFSSQDRALLGRLASDGDPDVARYARMVSERLANPTVSFLTPEEAQQLPTVVATEARECCICFDTCGTGSTLTALECGHQFHPKCIQPWLCRWATCPSCRAPVLPAAEVGLLPA